MLAGPASSHASGSRSATHEPLRHGGLATARSSAAALALLYGVVLLGFALPFASVSCGDTRTERLTGIGLVVGSDPGITDASGEPRNRWDEDDRRDTEQTVGKLQFFARAQFVLTAAGVVFAVAAIARSSRQKLAPQVFLLPGALLTAFSFVSGVGSGLFDVMSPTVHHHNGFWIAAILSWTALLPALVYCRYETERLQPVREGVGAWLRWLTVAAAVAGLLTVAAASISEGLFMLAFVLGAAVCIALFVTAMVTLASCRLAAWPVAAAVLGGLPPALLAGGL